VESPFLGEVRGDGADNASLKVVDGEARMNAPKPLDFLATKVMVPSVVPGLIERPRLLRLLDQISTKQLAVIKGGAGFGKTSLAAGLAARLRQNGHVVAWLALDEADSEPTRFLFYVAQALRRAGGTGEATIKLISDLTLVAPEMVATSLINEIVDVDEDIYLIIDDYQLIEDTQVHAVLAFLLKHAPRRFHLILATRGEPALPVASIRVQNQLLEIDAAAVLFDVDETLRFLKQENIVATPTEARLLQEKTNGWPALIRIFAWIFARSGQGFSASLRQLSGSLSPIGTYLDEILDSLPRELVDFMLRTAILERLSGPLCQAVTGAETAQEFLETIVARQLLLTPIDSEGRWWRYHPILAEHLNEKLKKERAVEIPWLHRHAYYWYASQQMWTQAVQHAFAAGDRDQALAWIEKCAMDLVKTGDLLTLMDWQRLFPTTLMRGQLGVRIAIAWGMALALRFDEASELSAGLRKDVDESDMASTDKEAMKCECDAISACALALKDDSQAALTLAETCLPRTRDPWTANVASNVARLGYLKAGDLKSFYAVPWIPYSQSENRVNLFAAVYHRCLLGLAEFQQFRFPTAERHYLEGIRLAEEHIGPNSIAAALPASLLARIRYEQGRLEEAEALVIDRIQLVAGAGMLECALSAILVLARIAAWRGNFERARAILEQAESHGYERGWGRLIAFVLTERVRIDLLDGRSTEASAYVERLDRLAAENPATALCAWSEIGSYAMLGRAWLAAADNRLNDSIALFASLQDIHKSAENQFAALNVATYLSIVLFRANEIPQAIATFRAVASAAAAVQVDQFILEAGPQIGPLLLQVSEPLQSAKGDRELSAYLQSTTSRWRARYQQDTRARSASDMGDSLSARERSILERIGHGKSNKEIAKDLSIAPETVKSHVKNIFVKLAVEKRAQAVARAQSLGLSRTPF
jgi:LuxR family maltose regulon positive regulatory protein